MSDFGSRLSAWTQKVERMSRDTFVNVASAVKSSITDGSPLTGAPGQPVDTGNLKSSWVLAFETPDVAVITTNVEYAPIIEHNVRNATLRSQVGGFHSVALTTANFDRLVAAEVAKGAK